MPQTLTTSTQLGQLLQGARKAHGWTQSQLAQRVGISQETLSVNESAPGRLTVDRLLMLTAALGLELIVREKRDNPAATATPSEW